MPRQRCAAPPAVHSRCSPDSKVSFKRDVLIRIATAGAGLNGYALFRGNGGHGLSFEQSTTRAIRPGAHRSRRSCRGSKICAELLPLAMLTFSTHSRRAAAMSSDLVRLFRALGGGWSATRCSRKTWRPLPEGSRPDSSRLISYTRPWIVDLSSLPGAALEDCVSL